MRRRQAVNPIEDCGLEGLGFLEPRVVPTSFEHDQLGRRHQARKTFESWKVRDPVMTTRD